MKTKASFKSKKGISPILATLLLIVIAVAAIVVTYAWIMIYMHSAGQRAGIQLEIEVVSWPSGGTIKLYVRNTGTSDATIDAVYVGTSPNNYIKQDIVDFNPPNKFVAANGGTIEVTIQYDWAPQTMYYFKVAPLTGPAAERSERAP